MCTNRPESNRNLAKLLSTPRNGVIRMSDIDGRQLGGTGEYRGDHEPDREVERRQIQLRGSVERVDCTRERGEGTWQCRINGKGSGYRDSPIGFDALDVDPSARETRVEGNTVVTEVEFPSGVNCEVDRTQYAEIDGERILVCPA